MLRRWASASGRRSSELARIQRSKTRMSTTASWLAHPLNIFRTPRMYKYVDNNKTHKHITTTIKTIIVFKNSEGMRSVEMFGKYAAGSSGCGSQKVQVAQVAHAMPPTQVKTCYIYIYINDLSIDDVITYQSTNLKARHIVVSNQRSQQNRSARHLCGTLGLLMSSRCCRRIFFLG